MDSGYAPITILLHSSGCDEVALNQRYKLSMCIWEMLMRQLSWHSWNAWSEILRWLNLCTEKMIYSSYVTGLRVASSAPLSTPFSSKEEMPSRLGGWSSLCLAGRHSLHVWLWCYFWPHGWCWDDRWSTGSRWAIWKQGHSDMRQLRYFIPFQMQ